MCNVAIPERTQNSIHGEPNEFISSPLICWDVKFKLVFKPTGTIEIKRINGGRVQEGRATGTVPKDGQNSPRE